eukprot:scaffold7339_cov111-Skeletonema_marinoi.AAC.4
MIVQSKRRFTWSRGPAWTDAAQHEESRVVLLILGESASSYSDGVSWPTSPLSLQSVSLRVRDDTARKGY